MAHNKTYAHPYIPNTVPEVRDAMLKEIGLTSMEQLHDAIPDSLKLQRKMDLPPAMNEYELRRHIDGLLAKNKHGGDYLNFLGAGCWQHFIPAVCDEINQRSEFVTAYAGEPYEDHGRFQALFEYQSLLAELVDMDVVNVPTFDWAQAASTAIRMAGRITGRKIVLLPRSVDPDKAAIIRNYCTPVMDIQYVDIDQVTGRMDLNDLRSKLSDDTAAIYFENPGYLGIIEDQGAEISDLAHKINAVSIVGVDPISLGVLEPPSRYGADIICGDLQPLGMHMNFGGGQAGFIATRDEEKYVMEYPSRLFGIVPTEVEGEYGFGDVAYERTSFALREKGKESVGTQTALWGITAGVYLALLGPVGMQEVGSTIIQKSHYAAKQISRIPSVSLRFENGTFFKEFVVDFNDTGLTVDEINQRLMETGIFGGKDLSSSYPAWGQCALYCVTETHTQSDLDRLVDALRSIVSTS
ncbi:MULTISPECIES: aminomethyl-transferring glycine dehydrogenase subunit GcvPA [Paenibacillus]|uniref:aminomethyl-transferring glycine dehydrogenase subunit GcvPA n=1 Tax=Paenibacillus TaxID=44249 RepID=UPI0003FEE75F|nr:MULTISPECIES: aminomethyl-transferring glycine dehydrogenase subunit GcvPA [Paenibacillus]KGP83656.1 glycine dehydrogenase [Paenibacillus sp. MAEPY2]KGP87836.1 glycine dehydrogenase [Paenibacillus sp. MAEPY1]OZQ61038.1 glycine dehydrogenase [Paenibacillus taichungensis]HBU81424.1 aminomethyl-transferring glycine dehydrogenase subunit GcvPA [Paenibacillus sp.]